MSVWIHPGVTARLLARLFGTKPKQPFPEVHAEVPIHTQPELDAIDKVTARLKGHTHIAWLGLVGPDNKEIVAPGYKRMPVYSDSAVQNDLMNIVWPNLGAPVTISKARLYINGVSLDMNLAVGGGTHISPGNSLTVNIEGLFAS